MSTTLKHRAVVAYIRKATVEASGMGEVMYPTASEVTHKELDYIVLHNTRGVLAVYRVRTVNGQAVLKGLKRWPAELNGV